MKKHETCQGCKVNARNEKDTPVCSWGYDCKLDSNLQEGYTIQVPIEPCPKPTTTHQVLYGPRGLSSSCRPKPRAGITNSNYVLTFGQYKGKTLGELLRIAPAYIIWAHNNVECIDVGDALLDAAQYFADWERESRRVLVIDDYWDS